MPATSTSKPPSKQLLIAGIGLFVVSLGFLIGLGIYLGGRGGLTNPGATADAMLYIDVPGRIAINEILQVDGPAPVPVAAGIHTLTFFDVPSISPLEVSVDSGQFKYVPNPAASRFSSPNAAHGVVHVSAFPPDTTIEIPNCTPIDAKRPVVCNSRHTLDATLSPGVYSIGYSNPSLGQHQEDITVSANATVRREYSYIATVAEWDDWRRQHGNIIERQTSRRRGGGGAFLLPFEATGEIFKELFD